MKPETIFWVMWALFSISIFSFLIGATIDANKHLSNINVVAIHKAVSIGNEGVICLHECAKQSPFIASAYIDQTCMEDKGYVRLR